MYLNDIKVHQHYTRWYL